MFLLTGALRDDTKNGCLADYTPALNWKNVKFPKKHLHMTTTIYGVWLQVKKPVTVTNEPKYKETVSR